MLILNNNSAFSLTSANIIKLFNANINDRGMLAFIRAYASLQDYMWGLVRPRAVDASYNRRRANVIISEYGMRICWSLELIQMILLMSVNFFIIHNAVEHPTDHPCFLAQLNPRVLSGLVTH